MQVHSVGIDLGMGEGPSGSLHLFHRPGPENDAFVSERMTLV
jgi:hypothetical protein